MSKEEKDEKKPEPFYHESAEYSSAFFGPVPDKILESLEGKTDDKTKKELAEQLSDPQFRETKPDLLNMLRENESQDLLVEMIADKNFRKQRAVLIAACWETGLNFSKYLEVFVHLLSDKYTDDFSAIEIATVIDEMPGPFEKEMLENCIRGLEKMAVANPLKIELINGIQLRLRSFMNSN
jgi:hypothetical protein